MDELIFVLEPLEDEMNPTMGWGNDVSIEHYLCDKDDPSLEKRFHRKYEVYVEDGSGNRSEAFVVGTGRGCGCWSAPASPGAVALLALLGAAGMRRRD